MDDRYVCTVPSVVVMFVLFLGGWGGDVGEDEIGTNIQDPLSTVLFVDHNYFAVAPRTVRILD